ncbi:MAG: hypothetical protein R2800_04100 [Flavipsychrobacter sp.]
MNNDKKHIDDFFKEELDNHTEPITSEEFSLFEETIGANKKRRFINPKYLKWLPYLAGLSAAAAVGYVATPLFSNKTVIDKPVVTTKKVIYKKQEQQLNKIPTNSIDSFLTIPTTSINPQQQNAPITNNAIQLNLAKLTTNTSINLLRAELKQDNKLNNTSKNVQGLLATNSYSPNSIKNLIPTDEKGNIDITFSLGAETNTGFTGINTTIASLQLRYRVAPKLYVGISPGFKFGNINQISLPERLTFYNTPYYNVDINQNSNIPNTYDYHYTEIYDSIDAKYALNRNMWDIELPIFWEYAFSKKVSLVAGINFVYGKLPQITKKETRYTKIYQDSLLEVPFIFPQNNNGIVLFEPKCNCISDNDDDYKNPTDFKLRTGYTLGVNFRPIDKMLLNISIYQNSSDLSYIPNPDIRDAYNATRLRFSLGYKINRTHK